MANIHSMTKKLFIKTHGCAMNEYDSSRMQELLFVIPSFQFLRREVEQLVQRLAV